MNELATNSSTVNNYDDFVVSEQDSFSAVQSPAGGCSRMNGNLAAISLGLAVVNEPALELLLARGGQNAFQNG